MKLFTGAISCPHEREREREWERSTYIDIGTLFGGLFTLECHRNLEWNRARFELDVLEVDLIRLLVLGDLGGGQLRNGAFDLRRRAARSTVMRREEREAQFESTVYVHHEPTLGRRLRCEL